MNTYGNRITLGDYGYGYRLMGLFIRNFYSFRSKKIIKSPGVYIVTVAPK